jgi:1,4-alpha-glucan branching enzyme
MPTQQSNVHAYAGQIGDTDFHLFNEGKHVKLYEKLGAHPVERDGKRGVVFRTWAPNAARVSLVSSFNNWNPESLPLHSLGASGIWETFVPDLPTGTVYKYHIESSQRGYQVDKADPYGFHHEIPPRTGSVVWDMNYTWSDDAWLAKRAGRNGLAAPISVYEVHLPSWRRVAHENNRSLTYREAAPLLAAHVKEN